MLTKLTVAGMGIAAAIILAPTATADSDNLGNADVAKADKGMSLVEQFIYCFEHNPYKVSYSNGLSGSSQSMLDRVNANKPHIPPAPAE